MSPELSPIVAVMRDFADESIGADEFVARYAPLWRQLRDAQYEAIDRTPGMAIRLSQLRDRLVSGVLTERQFRAAVQHEYARLDGDVLRPGGPADEALGHVFVECDAYGSPGPEPDDHGDRAARERELRAEVQQAIEVVRQAA